MKCVEIYFAEDGTMSVAVEQDVMEKAPDEQNEQRQPVKSLDEVMQILQAVQQDGQPQEGAEMPEAEPQGEGFEQGFKGVRGGGLGGPM